MTGRLEDHYAPDGRLRPREGRSDGPRVWVVQRPTFKAADGTWMDKFDFVRAAEQWGRLYEVIEQPEPVRWEVGAMHAFAEVLRAWEGRDFLLCVGDPSLFAVMVSAAMIRAKEISDASLVDDDTPALEQMVSILSWHRLARRYELRRMGPSGLAVPVASGSEGGGARETRASLHRRGA